MRTLLCLGFGLITGVVWAEDLDGAMAAAINAEQGGRKNITLGAMFQEEFRQQEGVKELKGGLLYKVVVSGSGKTPKLSDRVKVRYEGRHVDGRVFDKSKGEESQEFRVDRTVAGWQEVLPLMREGDKWEVVVPSHLAYGAKGSPFGNIGPNETLVFTIELMHVMDPGEKSAAPVAP
jgi:FKBP-type peptidyl-prolyl cis-trans isomerase FklB